MQASITSRAYGVLATGERVDAYTLTGSSGIVLEALTYGGIVTRLLAPDRVGKQTDVVLGYNSLDAYVKDRCYFGAIVGRVAGRISSARFELNGKTYELPANEGQNHLHGGWCGFNKRLWKATMHKREDGAPSLRLTRCSPCNEEGYPGTVQVAVTYTVTHNNEFLIEAEAESDLTTPFSMTHHSYFNLAGEDAGPIVEHQLQIHADEFAPTSSTMRLLGRVEPVWVGYNDFREPLRIGDEIPKLFQQHGDLYRLCRDKAQAGTLATAARLVEPKSGRVLNVATTHSWMQMYTGSGLNESGLNESGLDKSMAGKSGTQYVRHAGVCLECHEYPVGLPGTDCAQSVLLAGQPQRWVTAYAFGHSSRG